MFSKKSLFSIGILSFGMTLSGCGAGKLDIPIPTIPKEEIQKLASGKWVSPCLPDLASPGRYFTEEFSLSETLSVNRVRNYFSDSACSTSSYSVDETGTAQINPLSSLTVQVEVEHEHEIESEEEGQCEEGDSMPAEVAAEMGAPGHEADGSCDDKGRWKIKIKETHLENRTVSVEAGMRGIDMLLSGTKITIHSESEAAEFSAAGVCGKVDWSAGVSVELSSDCSDDSKKIHHKHGGKHSFDVYKQEGESVYFGDDSLESESPEVKRQSRRGKEEDQVENDRPTTLGKSHPYVLHVSGE